MKSIKQWKIAKLYRFVKYSKHHKTMVLALALSGFYRFQIKFIKPSKLKKHWGLEGQETPQEDLERYQYQYAWVASYAVNRVCNKTAWESKCLVRALTARRLLMRKHIPCTLYLGCGYDENKKMVAHAWLRAGNMYVTGGNGEGYAVVDKFKN